MALPWQWILEKLARQPDVPIDTIRELIRYVPQAAEQASLQEVLALRQLQEVIESEEESVDSSSVSELITTLASPGEDVSELLGLVAGTDLVRIRSQLSKYVQRKLRSLGTPILDKIAYDIASGVYPPDKSVRSLAKQKPNGRHWSVGSEDTTVIINGEEELKKKTEGVGNSSPRAGSSPQIDEPEEVSPGCKRRSLTREDASLLDIGKRLCRDLSAKFFKQQEKSAEDGKVVRQNLDQDASGKSAGQAEREHSPAGNGEQVDMVDIGNVNTRRFRRKVAATIEDTEPVVQKETVLKGGLEALKEFEEPTDVGEDNNSDTCYKCRKRGSLICCDGCPISMHLKCLGKAQIPPGSWFCPRCALKIAIEKLARAEEELIQAKLDFQIIFGKQVPAKNEAANADVEAQEANADVEAQAANADVEAQAANADVGAQAANADVGAQAATLSPKDEAVAQQKDEASTSSEDGKDASTSSGDVKRYPKRTPSRSGREQIPHERRKKLAWTPLEEATLKEGVSKYEYKWTRILQFGMGKFHPSRTGVDLKDKWRNMIKRKA